MKTSALLANEYGEPIHDFYLAFTAAPGPDGVAGPGYIATSLVIEGVAQSPAITPVQEFLQPIDRPFAVDVADVVYLNADCHYREDALAVIGLMAARDDLDIRFVQVLPKELDGLDLGLSGDQRRAFQLGRPIWRRGARSSSAGRGQKGYSIATQALRDAIQAWTVIGEQVIRLAFERAQREGLAFRNRHQIIRESSEGLIGIALGYYPSGRQFEITLPEFANAELALGRFKYEATHHDGRKTQFVRPGLSRSKYLGSRAWSQKPRYAAMPASISESISDEIGRFVDLHPNCAFDPMALAKWVTEIVRTLRIAHSASLSVDGKRAAARERLRRARTPEQLQQAAREFALEPMAALRVLSRAPERDRNHQDAYLGLHQLLSLQDIVTIALLADFDPQLLNPHLVDLDRPYADALLNTARWLGRLYRERHAVMNLPQAQQLLFLATARDLPDNHRAALQSELRTMLSFLTPDGQASLWTGAASVVRDGLHRSVFVTKARPNVQRAGTNTLADEDFGTGGRVPPLLPDAILVPGGYLLVPGDFTQAWQGQCADLMACLEEPDARR